MVEIPNGLRTLFHAALEDDGGRYVIEVPREEVERETVAAGRTYRVAVFPGGGQSIEESPSDDSEPSGPPVAEGEIRDVEIETIGDQGDGIAKVERGYVVIVPDAEPGETVTVEIDTVQANVAFARVRGGGLGD